MNKLTKLLSVFVIAGAIGTGVAGITACNNGGGGGSHTHNYSYTDNHDGTHDGVCDCGNDPITGEAHIWGDDNVCDKCEAVRIDVESIAIEGDEEVVIGAKITLTAVLTPANATATVTWSIKSGADKAEINSSTGELTGIKEGLVTVQAEADGKTAVKYISVKPISLTGVTLPKTVLNLKPEDEFTLEPVFTPENATNKKINWISSAPTIATVDEDGKVKGVADGKATITGTSEDGNFRVTCAVEVDHTFVAANYEVNVGDKFETGKTDEERRVSFVTLGAQTEVRTRTKGGVYENKPGGAQISDIIYEKSIKLGGSNDKIIFNLPAAGTLKFHVQNGSSGVTGWVSLSLAKKGGTPQTVRYSADDGSLAREVVVEISEAGEYTLTRTSGTSDVYYASFECMVKETPLEKIEVTSPGKNQYFVGQTYDKSGIQLDKVYSVSGRTEALDINDEGVTVNDSQVDMTQAGVYPVTVTYNDGTNDFVSEAFNVTVYAVESISLGTDAIVKESKNTTAGNGVYANHHLRELYIAGETFSTDGMTVIVNASIGDGAEKQTQSFIIKDGYTLSGNDVSTAGKKTVTVTLDGTSYSENFEVYVIDGIEDLSNAKSVSVSVDGGLADDQIGVIKEGAYQFRTIHQALEFLENCKAPASASKIMTLAAGTYTEKLEINVPNLTIIGAGTNISGTYSMIEWDSLYGIKDDSGFVHTTDSTATLNVREAAVGFTMRNLVVSNWYNCAEHFNERFPAEYGEHRALAMLVQADKVVVDGCTLLGYQDTLELFTGRHVFTNSLIVGVTDFIFGTNGTTYFKNCEVRAIKHVKEGQIGYYTAMKGNNKGTTTDKVKYGLIFDDCDFTAEDGVAMGWSLGRVWGADAAVMIMNSRLGGHIATGVADRYTAMNSTPDKAQFTEYGNTGAGAINASQTGVTVLDATAAAEYAKYDVIFGMTNGLVKYADAWNGESGAKVTTEKYDFTEVAKGSTETVQDHFAGKLEWTGSGSWNGNSIYVNTDTVIKLVKPGKIMINWYGGYGSDADAEITYDAEGKATINIITAGRYIVDITVNMAVIPEASVNRTVSVYVMGEGEPTLLGTITKPDGNVICEANITALITGEAYSGKLLDKVYASDKTTEYTYEPITGDTAVYVTLKDANKTWQVGETISLAIASGTTPTVAGVTFAGDCSGHGSELKTNVGTTITIDIAAGAHISIEWYPSDNGQYGGDGNATIDYSVAGKVTITIKLPGDGETGGANGNIYIRSISIIAAE